MVLIIVTEISVRTKKNEKIKKKKASGNINTTKEFL